ncbi:MAG: acyl-CoA dehydrogenase family protein [Armatimonadota bacterium]|nr:acyl-CoA dehydrogenase family protein [Armatimonadota bacterium]MDR7439481.1 acyl-CoA dehydrogenase family protein [Armatimonadota bacterium]MDR7563142.1 acyl-CoA dehydrogenase family protein [Armatimonadota bacterium]MDR7567991.1 acyl-CoA dehydrogenase family protein [Armatimonadota bacterium]MDR7600941.1 acyl-CoA dehydrogenase family protein [Armatimonadota bacterium]
MERGSPESLALLRESIRELCKRFPDEYWRELDRRRAYPEEFIRTLTEQGYLSILIPEEYGGAGLGITEASVILEEINRSGGNASACHAQMYTMAPILRYGSEEQKRRYLPKIASGELRLQAFAVTEPDAGSDTTRITTFARRVGDRYVIRGQKIFISRVLQSDLMLLLARTTRYEEVAQKTEGMSLFLIDLRESRDRIRVTPIETMLNHPTYQVHFDDLEVPADALVGEEGKGFRYIVDGWNAERILVAAEAIGDARWFIQRAVEYAKKRVVFGRPIGANQGIQFPIAQAFAHVEAADLMRFEAARRFDLGKSCGAQANMAKLLATEASWEAANVCMNVHGGYGFAVEYDVERKFRETRLLMTAPVSPNLILAYLGHRVLGLPRSY